MYRSSNIPYDVQCGEPNCYCQNTCPGCMSTGEKCTCEEMKQNLHKVKTISKDLRNLGLLVSKTVYQGNAFITVHLCIGSGSSRFSLDEPFVLYHKRPLDGKEKQVFAEFASSDISEYLSDVIEILMNPQSCFEFNASITELAKSKCQGEFISLLPKEFQTKKSRKCSPSECLKVPNDHYVLLHFSEKETKRNSATVTTYIVAARYAEDHALSETPFYMIIMYYNTEFNLLAADGFYFETSTYEVKGYLDPTVPLYHHLVTISEAQDILSSTLSQMMKENGVYSLSTLLHRANQIKYVCVMLFLNVLQPARLWNLFMGLINYEIYNTITTYIIELFTTHGLVCSPQDNSDMLKSHNLNIIIISKFSARFAR